MSTIYAPAAGQQLSPFGGRAADLPCTLSTAARSISGPMSTGALPKRLEARLGVRLLERTTRHVSPTLDGEERIKQWRFYRRDEARIREVQKAVLVQGLLRVVRSG